MTQHNIVPDNDIAPANDNTRPLSFDARVMAYVPGLRKAVNKRVRDKFKREDVFQDSFVRALENWEDFRHDGDYRGLYGWLVWQVRSVVCGERKSLLIDAPLAIDRATTPPNQDDAAALSEALRCLETMPFGNDVLLTAAGVEQDEIAKVCGISKQAVSQRCQRARKDLRDGVGARRAYNRVKPRMRRVA